MSFQASINHQSFSPPADMVEQPAVGRIIEQLRAENQSLHNDLLVQNQEYTWLHELILTISAPLMRDDMLRRLADTVVRATACNVACIYLYDAAQECLVLSCATDPYRHLVGKIALSPGEGVAGWVALHRQPVLLKEDAMKDPRFCYFPELEEEKFQALLSMPMMTREGRLVGVITIQAITPHDFTEQQRTFISTAALLLAGLLERGQLETENQRKTRLASSLSILSQMVSAGLALDDFLRSLAVHTVQMMEADLCVIMQVEQARERGMDAWRAARRFSVHTTAPILNAKNMLRPIEVDALTLDRVQEVSTPKVGPLTLASASAAKDAPVRSFTDEELRQLDPLKDERYTSFMTAPVMIGGELLGLIHCYASSPRRFVTDDQMTLSIVANQAAIAMKNHALTNQLAQRNHVKEFFDDLVAGTAGSEESLKQRGHFLGCDLTRPHTVAMMEIAFVDGVSSEGGQGNSGGEERERQTSYLHTTTYKRVAGAVRRRIVDSYPGSIFYEQENMLTSLIALNKDLTGTRLKTWLQELTQQIRSEYHVALSIGIGNVCQHLSDYRRGFAEASEALSMGHNLAQGKDEEARSHPIVTHFNDLGVYRYLYKIAHMDDLRDVYQEQVARVDSYDRRKNTDLLDTLETYLECAGNLTKTSERLFVHRNTLIQRLERLQSLCTIDLQERGNWLTLQVAIKVYKLRTSGM